MKRIAPWQVRALALAVAGAGVFGISSGARATPFFDITDVGPGTLGAHDINSLGQITGGGLAAPGGITDAFLFTPGIGLQDLGRLNDVGSAGLAVNDAGQVVGDSGGSAFLFSNGKMQDIGTAPGFTGGSAAGINASGQVAFDVVGFTTGLHAALFSNGTVTDLGTLGGPTSITAKTNFAERPITSRGRSSARPPQHRATRGRITPSCSPTEKCRTSARSADKAAAPPASTTPARSPEWPIPPMATPMHFCSPAER